MGDMVTWQSTTGGETRKWRHEDASNCFATILGGSVCGQSARPDRDHARALPAD